MTATYDLIASNVLSTNASSVTFSSLPSSYRDLVLVFNVIHQDTTPNYDNIFIRPNNSSSNISFRNILGNGSTASSSSGTGDRIDNGGGGLSETWALFTAQFFDYAQTNKHKSYLVRGGNPASSNLPATLAHVARWADTTAISSLVVAASSNFRAGSSFHLYGIVS